MKRTFLALISVLAMAVAGAAFAQTDTQPYDSTDPAATTTAEATSQPGAMDSTSGSTAGATADPATTSGSPTEESMPATASSLPLVLTLGISALGGAVALRLYRLRRAH
jgi:hypothetical protein